ncbi:MAG: HD domain-containing phosphohydrolase, partial [Desulfosarcina sp.]
AMMKASIEQFLKISKALSEERNFSTLLEMILQEAKDVSRSMAGAIALRSQDDESLETAILSNDRTSVRLGGTSNAQVPFDPVPLIDADGGSHPPSAICHAVLTGEVVQVGDMEADERFDYTDVRQQFDQADFQCRALLIVPLVDQKDSIIGTLQLIHPKNGSSEEPAFSAEIVSYIKALSSDAAVALDNRRLLQAQKDLIDSIIHLIAGSIDAKSPYTSRHCQRVPIIVGMLAEAAQAFQEEPFDDFSLSESENYALHLASWLHDCGKLTTPEYVVDKATKLETIYNRIHEIRMRFEVLWRDAEIDYYQSLVDGSELGSELNRKLLERRVKLQRDFAFVAQCNIGGEFMSDERVERLQRIASQTWLRHFDDRLGVSQEELERKHRHPQPVLPVRERLLADKPEHLVKRPDNGDPFGTNPYGFNMEVPKYLYNYGELTNLTIARGTLTSEERFAINNHIIQTIKMLRTLPLPRELQQVPAWAGNHHEAYCGQGYPRRLVGRDLSIPERIMAVADVFEALTATDRPYKRARPLSETLKTMSDMCRQGHLCPDIFRLLMASGVYRRYAEAHLDAAQLDAVDVDAILADIHPSVCATPERLASAS